MKFPQLQEVRVVSGIPDYSGGVIAILAYHKVDKRFEWGLSRVTPRQFRRQMEFLRDNGWQVCSLGEYLANASPDKIGLTFDDAYETIYHNAYPVLEEMGASFTVFPVVNYIGEWNRWEVNLGWRRFKHLSWRQLKSMKGAEIGSHTLTHPNLIGLPDDTLEKELKKSRKILEDVLGNPVKYLSLPFGRYDRRTLEAARQVGYEAVCSLNPDDGEANYVIGRWGVYLIDSLSAFQGKIRQGSFSKTEKLKLRLFNWAAQGTILVKSLRKSAR